MDISREELRLAALSCELDVLQRAIDRIPVQTRPIPVQTVSWLLLQSNADVNAVTRGGQTPLHVACTGDHYLDFAEALIAHGAALETRNQRQQVPLHISSVYNNSLIAHLLLESHCNMEATGSMQATAVHYACTNGSQNVLQLLIARGANLESVVTNGRSPLHIACAQNHAPCVELLLAAGVQINEFTDSGHTPLMLASSARNDQSLTVLLMNGALDGDGAVVNTQNPVNGKTAMHYVCSSVVAQFLIAAGADVNISDHRGYTVLHSFCILGDPRCVRLILQAGGNVSARDNDGNTPLHLALRSLGMSDTSQLRVVEELLQANANPRARNYEGGRPHQYAYWQVVKDRLV